MYKMDEYQQTLQAESKLRKEASAAEGTEFDQREKASETEGQYKMMEQGMEDSGLLRRGSEHMGPCMEAEEGEHCRWEEERDLDPDLDLMAGVLHALIVEVGHNSPEACWGPGEVYDNLAPDNHDGSNYLVDSLDQSDAQRLPPSEQSRS